MNERSRSEMSLGLIRPVWVPDAASDTCQECGVKFTFVIRKHHCRACGRLLCSTCSSFKEPLEYLGGCQGRVCRVCHTSLRKPPAPRRNMRKTKSLNDFDELKENISRLVRSQKLAEAAASAENSEAVTSDLASLLPLELLARIMEFLPFSDLRECRLVTRSWLAAVTYTRFYSRAFISIGEEAEERLRLFVNSESSFKHFLLYSLPFDCKFPLAAEPSCLFIRTLKFYDSELQSAEMLTILKQSKNLKCLGLVNCKQLFMSGTFLNNLNDRNDLKNVLLHLEELVLDHNSYLSDVLLLRIVSSLQQLQILSLSNCNVMNHSSGVVTRLYPECEDTPASSSVLTWRIVARVVSSMADSLRSLDISRNTGIKIEDLCDIDHLDLHHLDIKECTSISAEGFLGLLNCQKNIQTLNIAGARKILSGLKEQTRTIFEALRNVTNIDISDNSIPDLSSLSKVARLQKLTINNVDTPGSSIVSTLESLDTSSLQTLSGRQLAMSSLELGKIIRRNNLGALRKLDLSRGAGDTINDEVMTAVCSRLFTLEYLDLSGNEMITDIGTLDLRDEVSKKSVMEVMEGRIQLGSKAEAVIVLESKKIKLTVELLSKVDEAEDKRSRLTNLKRLTHLDLSGTSISSLTLSHGLDSPDLRYLAASDCRGGLISDQGIVEACRRHRRLSDLRLASSCVTDLGLVSCVSSLPRLTSLDLRRCLGVSSGCLSPLSQIAPQLHTLLLSGCPSITPDMAKSVSQKFYRLRKIDL